MSYTIPKLPESHTPQPDKVERFVTPDLPVVEPSVPESGTKDSLAMGASKAFRTARKLASPVGLTLAVNEKIGEHVPAVAVVTEGIKNAVRGVTVDLPLSLLGQARSGDLDKLMQTEGASGLSGKGYFETIADGFFGSETGIIKETALGKMADEFVKGTNSDPDSLTTKIYSIFNIADNPKAQAKIAEWSAADPLTGNAISSVVNWGKLALANTEMLASAGVPGAGYLHIKDVMYEGWVRETKSEFDKRGWEFNQEEWSTEAQLAALTQGALEKAGSSVSLAAATGRSLLTKLIPALGKATKSTTLALGKVGVSQAGSHAAEGGTEYGQSYLGDFFTNKALDSYADANELERNAIPAEETKAKAITAGLAGVFASVGIQAPSSPMQYANVYQRSELDKVVSQGVSKLSNTEIGRVVQTYRQTSNKYTEDAVAKADKELRAMLVKEEEGTLLSMARSFDLRINTANKEDLIELLVDNKMRLPEYREAGLRNVLENINASENSSLQKNIYKWLAQGDITDRQIVGIISMWEKAIENSKYDGTLEEYFDEFVAPMSDDKGFIELNQVEAYHGGGKFDNFDLSYSGSGEGAAAFGWGAYLTQKFGIAKDYARPIQRRTSGFKQGGSTVQSDMFGPKGEIDTHNEGDMMESYTYVSPEGKRYTLSTGQSNQYNNGAHLLLEIKEISNQIINQTMRRTESLQDTLKELEESELKYIKESSILYSAVASMAQDTVLDMIEKGVTYSLGEANVYKITAFKGAEPHEYNLLSWYDAVPNELLAKIPGIKYSVPLSKMILGYDVRSFDSQEAAREFADSIGEPRVRYRIGGMGADWNTLGDEEVEGKEVYNSLVSRLDSQKAASEFLLANGIDGIVYPAKSLSTGSTELTEGENNFVIFDDKQIHIEEANAYSPDMRFFQTEGTGKPDVSSEEYLDEMVKSVTPYSGKLKASREQIRGFIDKIYDILPKLVKARGERDSLNRSTPGLQSDWVDRIGEITKLLSLHNDSVLVNNVEGINIDELTLPNTVYTKEERKYRDIALKNIKDLKKGSTSDLLEESEVEELSTELKKLRANRDNLLKKKKESREYVMDLEREYGNLGGTPDLNSVARSVADRMIFGGDKLQVLNEGGSTFHQQGRKTENGQVIRGQVSVLQEGKFMLDLFKTGDVVTLAHEFAHLMSPVMTDKTNKALVASIVKRYHPTAHGGAKSAVTLRYEDIWSRFQADPFQPFNEKDKATLTRLQEELAVGFETYMSTGKPPNHLFSKAFSDVKETMLGYYKRLSTQPLEFRDIDQDLAESFDELLAGDMVMPEVVPDTIRLTNKDGKVSVYTIHKNRPQNRARANIMRYLNRWASDKDGLHSKLREYANVILGEVPNVMDLEIGNIDSRKKALSYMNKIDGELAKRQAKEKTDAISKLKKLVKGIKKGNMIDEVKESLDYILQDLDLRARTGTRVRRTVGLSRALRKFNDAVSAIPESLRETTPEELADIAELNKKSPNSLSIDEINYTIKAVEDLRAFNLDQINEARDKKIAEESNLNNIGKGEFDKNWRMKKRDRSGKAKGLVKYFSAKGASMSRSILMLETLGDGVESNFIDKVVGDMRKGRHTQDALDIQFQDFTRGLLKKYKLMEHGVSEAIGRVSAAQKHIIKAGQKDVEMSTGQLMMFYGYSKNARARKKLLKNGFKDKNNKIPLYKFSSESELFTALANLSDNERAAVDDMMQYYDTVVYPIINKVYKRMNFGISLRKEDFYLPLFINWDNRGMAEFLKLENLPDVKTKSLDTVTESKGSWLHRHILSMDFLNIRKGGSQPIYSVDFMSGVDSNLTNVAFYASMAEPITQARVQLFGAKYQEDSIHVKLIKMYGETQVKAIVTWLDRIESNSFISDGEWESMITKADALSRRGILAGSISIAALQPVSARMAVNYDISEKDFNLAATTDLVSGYNIKQLIDRSPFLRKRYETLSHITGTGEQLKHRARSRWISPTTMLDQVLNVKTARDALDVVKDVHLGRLAMIMRQDARALSIVLRALESKHKGSEISEEALMLEFERVVSNTQPTNDPMYVSNFQSGPKTGFRLFHGAFRTARDAVLGDLQRSMLGLTNAMNGASDATRTRWAWRAVNSYLVGQGTVTALQELFYQLKKGDDDDNWDDNVLLSWALRMATNTLSLIPFEGPIAASAINAKLRGWDMSGAELPLISNLSQLYRELTDSDEIGKKSLDTLGALSRMFGLSFGNIIRDAEKLMPDGDTDRI